jgi:DNA-binding transcriptional ArsR family regulator
MKLDDASARLEALGNPTRLKIYRALVRAGDAGMPVGRLQDKLKIAPSTLSHHIKALVVVGLVTQVRESTTLVCHANYSWSISSWPSVARMPSARMQKPRPDSLRLLFR